MKKKSSLTLLGSNSLLRVKNSLAITEKFLLDRNKRDRLIAEYYYHQGKKRKPWELALAIEDFTNAIDLDSSNYLYYSSRGLAKHFSNDLNEAIKDYNKAISINPTVDLFKEAGALSSELKNYEEADVQYTNAIKLNPEAADIYYKRGIIKLNLKLYEDASNDFTKSIELKNANYPSDECEWGSYYRRGLIKLIKRNYEGAIQDLLRSTELSTRYYIPVEETELAFHYLGIAKFYIQDFKGSLESFSGAIWYGERYGSPLYHADEEPTGLILTESNKEDILHSISHKEYPNIANSYYNRAILKKFLNDEIDADSDFDRVKRILKNANRSNL